MRFPSGDHENPDWHESHENPEDHENHGTLAQAEINLLCDAIEMFLDTIHLHATLMQSNPDSSTGGSVHDDCFVTNIKAFDQLSVCEQLALMQSISQILVTERTLGTSLSSLHDAAIAVLIDFIRGNVEMELGDDEKEDDDGYATWRQRVHDVAAIHYNDPETDQYNCPTGVLPADDTDRESWSRLIDRIANHWLPDRDYELAELLMDADPSQSTLVKEQLGIHEDYFVDAIAEPTPEDFDEWLNQTRQLVRRKPR